MEIDTARLRLAALTAAQLRLYLTDPERLEGELGLGLSRPILTPRVRRAIELKLAKMAGAAPADHAWYTYWLVIVRSGPFGAGLAGYKGRPDARGEAEIGYGIDPAYEGRGYTTEAVRALLAWAFQAGECRAVIAPNTLKQNIGSNLVLAKAGMTVYEETAEAYSWRIDRDRFKAQQDQSHSEKDG